MCMLMLLAETLPSQHVDSVNIKFGGEEVLLGGLIKVEHGLYQHQSMEESQR